jgi:hypothetical protein
MIFCYGGGPDTDPSLIPSSIAAMFCLHVTVPGSGRRMKWASELLVRPGWCKSASRRS